VDFGLRVIPLKAANCTQEHSIGLLAHRQGLVAEGCAKSVYSNATYDTIVETKAVPEFLTHRAQNFKRLAYYLGANAIAGQNCYIKVHTIPLLGLALVHFHFGTS
jgi:hypothetical protein